MKSDSSSLSKADSSSSASSISKKSKSKKIDRVETSLKDATHDLSLFKFKSAAVVPLVLFVVFGLLNSLFEGNVVAKPPSTPLPSSGR
ncbi:hypothetical protein Tsubulata_026899 [Turnera subulata]|uniref:Transmembrane protein n=1 Tax=Turnera subulata TaxID=218843 RepID=A0A9Q0JDY6_9ROSI|nr:hypothetical protein Tsubulata_026899 [Turnera subulata]